MRRPHIPKPPESGRVSAAPDLLARSSAADSLGVLSYCDQDRELRREPSKAEARTVAWSVVIPTKNRTAQIERLVASLARQESPTCEIIVVDQSDQPAELTGLAPSELERGAPRLVYLHDPTIDGLTAARNIGLSKAASPYVIFLDDDAQPEPRCLRLLVEALERYPNLLAVGGLISNYSPPPLPIRWFRRLFYLGPLYDERQAAYWRARSYQPGRLIPTTKLNGGCMAFRRETIMSVGGFDSRYCGASIGEDIEISQRLLRWSRRRNALALVGGALIQHASRGNWKRSPHALEQEIVATHYWFSKNHPWSVANRLRFWWMCLGLLLWSTVSAVKRGSLGPLVRFWAGVRATREDYRGCPFLRGDAEGCSPAPEA